MRRYSHTFPILSEPKYICFADGRLRVFRTIHTAPPRNHGIRSVFFFLLLIYYDFRLCRCSRLMGTSSSFVSIASNTILISLDDYMTDIQNDQPIEREDRCSRRREKTNLEQVRAMFSSSIIHLFIHLSLWYMHRTHKMLHATTANYLFMCEFSFRFFSPDVSRFCMNCFQCFR